MSSHTHVQLFNVPHSILHIANDQLKLFTYSIINLLKAAKDDDDSEEDLTTVTITPLESTVICPTRYIKKFFQPIFDLLGSQNRSQLLDGEFFAIQVDGDAGQAGSQVLALTSPLANANIPIFFLTTYFSDYVLAPMQSKNTVTKLLESKGYIFFSMSNSYISVASSNESSGAGTPNLRPISTPPVQAPDLNKNATVPHAQASHRILLTSARADRLESFYLSLMELLCNPPTYMSFALASMSTPSLMLDESVAQDLLSKNILQGADDEVLVPLTLDLTHMPADISGVVYWVASQLVSSDGSGIPMSYLSTAQAGTVLVPDTDLDAAAETLRAVRKD
ncbi:hypothetical protein CANCADRAFT_81968 [Tortispora caseinolytica NRRL Y-17796]|uniref:CASTOR ACT domain-containing protein n=1 Tax=Tortispora caseinolytica NRRL Y-17796 TaxID=767744 RepID=A0A1E4TK27_9ASCO|nr:hypothetical protein CANCADRAFT_81968 [Tortispora caseinolytica NRRL Y-17796]